MKKLRAIIRRHPYRSLVAGLVVIAGLSAALMLMREMPSVVAVSFGNGKVLNSFANLGNGDWEVKDGVYELQQTEEVKGTFAGNASMSIYQTPITVSEWRLKATAKALSTTTVHDFSIVFDYIDEANYYYANFSDKTDSNFNGIFQVSGGKQKLLTNFEANIMPDKVYEIEIRKESGAVKVYFEANGIKKTFLGKAKTKTYNSMKVGFGSRGGSAVFDNLTVNGTGIIAHPDPTPGPENPAPDPTPTPTPEQPKPQEPGQTPLPTPTPTGNRRIVNVTNSNALVNAIKNVQPGDIIKLADGTYDGSILDANGKPDKSSMKIGDYTGTYAMSTPGTKERPITLEGSSKAVIDGGGTGGHYGLYLAGANYWEIKGITVTNATKGIVADHSNRILIDSVDVHTLGQEGIHLRDNSSDNIVRNSRIWNTGLKNETYGEGIYVGSANSNWSRYSGGQPDRSDRNQLIGNVVGPTSAENMDIKEGTTGGLIEGNTFNGEHMTGSWADSWIDMKGNDWTVRGNTGHNAKLDGFQIHAALSGWGNDNIFSQNVAEVNAAGYGFWLQNNVSGNVISCDNVVKGAAGGYSTTPCKQ